MEFQKAILIFFSSIENNVLDFIAKFITMFGEEIPLIAIILFIFWCIDKKKGFISCFILITASSLMSIIKAIVRFPRPWLVIPELNTQRIETATGYSFPSGHTTNSSSTFASLAFAFRKKWFSVLCAIIIAFVGISRCFLCCHWPLDVLCGWILGIGTSVILFNKIKKLSDDMNRFRPFLYIFGGCLVLISLIYSILLVFEKADHTAFSDLTKVFALGGGICIGYALETKICNFVVEENNWEKKIIRYLLGIAGIGIILPGGKALLQAIGIYNPFTAQIRYFSAAIWATFWPVLGVKLGLFEKANA